MKKVLRGATQVLSAAYFPREVSVFRDLMCLNRVLHNKYLYEYRQDYFAAQARWREGGPKFDLPSMDELKGLARGTHVRDTFGRIVRVRDNKDRDPGSQAWVIGALGRVWDRGATHVFGLIQSFWGQIKRYWALPDAQRALVGKPKPPGYHKAEHLTLTWRGDKLTRDGDELSFPAGRQAHYIRPPALVILPYVTELLDQGARLVEVTARPLRSGDVELHYVLEIEVPDAPKTLKAAAALGPVGSIDIGVHNLLALSITDLGANSSPSASGATSSPLPGPLLVRGGALVQACHKAREVHSQVLKTLPYQEGGKTRGETNKVRVSKRMKENFEHHHARMGHMTHTAAKAVVDALLASGARALVVGWNKGIKTSSAMGKRQNFRFGSVPHRKLLDVLKHQCALYGILYLEVEESYTSKTSFADGELPVKQVSYVGQRVKRGLFKTGTGLRVNADVNGSLQILVKALTKFGCKKLLTPAVRARALAQSLNPHAVQVNLDS